MTDTLISLISILVGILGAYLTAFVWKRFSFGLIGNTIAGVFGSILIIKSFGRLGFDPSAIMNKGQVDWCLFFMNMIASLGGGALSIVILKELEIMTNNPSGRGKQIISGFRIISFLEGVSYILLLFVGVPLKYLAGNSIVVKSLGMPHGMLFLAYIVMALVVTSANS